MATETHAGAWPTEDELNDAIKAAKAKNLTSTQIKMRDSAAAVVRHYLGLKNPVYKTIHLETLREMINAMSKQGREAGDHKRNYSPREIFNSSIDKMREAFPRADNHSERYHEIHSSGEYRAYRDALKKTLRFRCQGCGGTFPGSELQGHIVDYDNWKDPGMMLIVCGIQCHEVLDILRSAGKPPARGNQMPMWGKPKC